MAQVIFDVIVDACTAGPVVVPPPQQPPALATLAYAGHGYSDGVHVIDITTMTEVAEISGAGGYRMVLSNDGTKLFSSGGGSLYTVSNAISYTLTASFDPYTGFGVATTIISMND